jgi:phytoene dehydrogenase-like protein
MTDRSPDFEPVDVAVVGAGIAGLSAAVYARLAGLSVRVFERHYLPGGLCTAWTRRGYVFDYCMEWFMGLTERHGFYPMWKDLGIIGAVEFRPIASFGRYEAADGRSFELYTDPDRLERGAAAVSPADAGKIAAFCAAVRSARRFVMTGFAADPASLRRLARSLPALPAILAWSGTTVRAFAAGLRDPLLRAAFPELLGADISLAGPIIAFGLMASGDVGYPVGGSLPIAQAVAARAEALGADIVYRAGVDRVEIAGGRAVGLVLEDGRRQPASQVVAAGDLRATLDRLLAGRYTAPAYAKLFAEGKVYSGIVQVSLGVRLESAWGFAEPPRKLGFDLARTIDIDGAPIAEAVLYGYGPDQAMAPAGCAAFVLRFPADYERWLARRADPAVYRAEKERIQNETVAALDARFPGLASRIEASDVASPTSCERYTANWRGSTQGWLMTAERMRDLVLGRRPPTCLPGLAGFRLAGQWTQPGGGIPPSAQSGRDAVRAILKERRRLGSKRAVKH